MMMFPDCYKIVEKNSPDTVNLGILTRDPLHFCPNSFNFWRKLKQHRNTETRAKFPAEHVICVNLLLYPVDEK